MNSFPLSIRPSALLAWGCGVLPAVLVPIGFAAAAEPDPAPGFTTLATVFLIAVACILPVSFAAFVVLRKKNHELRTLQDEVNRLRHELGAIAITDALTGLFNRRYMDAQLKMALSYARRRHLPLSIVIADIDLFKSINDEHGHQRGDQILKGVATAIQSILRDEDIACRYGGEEFMLILPSTDLADGISCAERLRTQVESKALSGIKVTVSIGVASTASHADRGSEDLIERANKALYAAKVRGRNLVVSEADDIGAVQMPRRHAGHPPHPH